MISQGLRSLPEDTQWVTGTVKPLLTPACILFLFLAGVGELFLKGPKSKYFRFAGLMVGLC